ncbi:MAG TPA: glycosyltransferase family 1 protein, partial [Methanobacterium sp.]|nr:glycosyltransferase family 1 protein [Methanobacterium sp.]
LKHNLVIVGVPMDRSHEIFQTLKVLGIEEKVIFTGPVPEKDLVALYNAADLFVYPCLYAGFGIPPLEAMACGTPVITSNNSSLPEVVDDAGLLINPYNTTELAQSINALISDDETRKKLIKKGLKRSKLFKWSDTAIKTLEIYEQICKY